MTRPALAGVLAAAVTPLSPSGAPDTARFLHHARWLLAHGCDGLNVLGTTGEATSLPAADRLALMQAAARGLDPARLMVGTGCPDLATTIRLTWAAGELGYAGALVLPPFYYKGVAERGLEAWFGDLVDATTGGPPLYLYNFPQMTGITFSPDLVRRLVAAAPGRIVGAKDSSGDTEYAAELATIPDFAVFPSDEATLAEAPARGFAGCISATANVTSAEAAALRASPGDAARRDSLRACRAAIARWPLVPAVKHLVARLHGDPAFARPLPPLAPVTAEARQALDTLDLAALAAEE
jgi:4-hydroxy-tetrahydrodipicolinate synthase